MFNLRVVSRVFVFDDQDLGAVHKNVKIYFALQHKPFLDYHAEQKTTQNLPLGNSAAAID
jgi:hypothetical protein